MYKKGKTVRRAGVSLVFTKNTRGFTRVAVVVSKKVAKSAVERNRIRRRLYEVIRVNFDLVPRKMDYIFVVYTKDALKMPFGELESLMGELVAEAKVTPISRRDKE